MYKDGKYVLSTLPYGYDYLEDVIDAKTVEIHHSKHQQAYVDNLNKALESQGMMESDVTKLFESNVPAVKNNAGGIWNHEFYWAEMTKADSSAPSQKITKLMTDSFGGVDAFKTSFENAGLARFGSGWVWLVVNKEGRMEIVSTANQDNPLALGLVPVLGCDVWEHAYYLKYQNRRGEYLKAWWRLVDWDVVEKRMASVVK